MLQTKLHVPRLGANIVSRINVAKKLQNILDYRLTLITAPAGYGKTTAAAGFLSESGIPHAWFSVDPEDNDPVRFWQYLMAAVAGAVDSLGDSLADLPLSKELIAANVFTGLFIDQLYRIPGNLVLVLDDYHLIRDAIGQQSLVYFIKHMPSGLSVIILSRQEQDGGLTGMCLRGQALRIGRRDLAFNAGEIAQFYGQKGVRLTTEEVSVIEARTEGWVAGLVIASLAITEGADAHEAVRQFSGNNRFIDRYFNEEVFDLWPGEVQDFLIRTAILDRLTGPLCRAVTGREDSAVILQRLAEGNSFIIPLDQTNEWFRYHHLFAEYLKARLKQEDPAVVRSWYGLAGAWFQANGLPREAIGAFIKAEDFKNAQLLLREFFLAISNDGEFSTLVEWMSSFPPEIYENDVTFSSGYAWVLAMEGQLAAAEEWANRSVACFERIRDQLADAGMREYLEAQAAIARADIAIRHMDAAAAARCYAQACQLKLPDHIVVGEMNSGQPSMLRTVYGFHGRLNKIEEAYLPFAGHFPKLVGKASAYLTVMLIESLYERNKLQESYDTLLQGLEEVLALDNPGAVVPCFLTLAKIKRARGDLEGALHAVTEGKKKLHGKGRPYWEYLLDLFTARLYLDRNDVQGAGEWMDLSRLGIYDKIYLIRESEYLVFARYLCLAGQREEALLLTSRLSALAEKEDRLGSRIEILCLLAVVSYRQMDITRAISALDKALELGIGDGYTRTFIDESEPMAELLARYLKYQRKAVIGERYDYAKRLFELTSESMVSDKSKALTSGTVEGLTRTEYKVLQLLSAGRSNHEIADELDVTVRTIKYHNANLFGKLGAKNRLEALNRAKESGILH